MKKKLLTLFVALLLLLTGPISYSQCQGSPNFSTEKYSKKALDKTKHLSRFFEVISSNDSTPEEFDDATDWACKLFADESRIVQVSNKNHKRLENYRIRDYCDHLRFMNYDKVEIKWFEIGYTSNLKLGKDGNYYGTITIKQKFTGYGPDGKLKYTDITAKTVEVVVKQVSLNTGGQSIRCWDVFLGDIMVKNTWG